jgi:RimJ/RimL family protein N-acetyltransferase
MIFGDVTRLRRAERQDARFFASWTNDPAMRSTIGREQPTTVEIEENRLTALVAAGDHQYMIEAKDDGGNWRVIGAVGLHSVHAIVRSAWLGVMIGDTRLQGKGLGTDAVRAVCRHAFDDLGLHKVELDVLADNARAIRCYEKVGFKSEVLKRGAMFKEGVFKDELRMGLLREDLR